MSFPRSLSPRKRGAGIQGIETDPGFRVFARNDNAANSRKKKNMYALLPYGTRILILSKIYVELRFLKMQLASTVIYAL
jgi:hypothetical protein